jgi:Ice-binding-like/PEP-CTERM motif
MKTPKYLSILSLAVIGAFYGASPALAMPSLGTAQSFAVLGGSTVTNTGPTTIYGNVGVDPGSAITGFYPPGTVAGGSIYGSGGVSNLAQSNALTAYNYLSNLPFNTDLTGQDLGGLTLTPGVYYFSSSAGLTGTLTLDALTNTNALFVFQIGSTLTTAGNSLVNVIHGGANNGVYWDVGSSATLGTGTTFAGNILADQSITLTTGADILCGRAIALNGAVTMDTNAISGNCASGGDFSTGRSDYGSSGFSGGQVAAVPEPETYAMLLAGLGLLGFTTYRRKSLDV